MAVKASNKLLPILSGIVLLIVIVGIYLLTQTDAGKSFDFFSMDTKRVKTVNVDADSTVDTLETIATDSAELKSKVKNVNESIAYQNEKLDGFSKTLKELNQTNAALRAQIEEQNKKMEAMKDAGAAGTIDLDKVKQDILDSFQSAKSIPETIQKVVSGDYDINELPAVMDGKQVEGNGTGATTSSLTQIRIVEPETSTRVHSVNVPVGNNGEISPAFIKSLQNDNEETNEKRPDNAGKNKGPIIDPRYTIFANTILNDAVAVTTLIGRIPVQGDVGDPAPFKVIIGRENLAANGFTIPGLDGMIMSGTVFGDANLECVRGKVVSATYIFEDGRGITFPRKRRSKDKALGWISDEHGNPCIPGTYVSNVKTQMKNRIALAMAAGAANAFATAETTTTTNSNGGTSTSVTGDTSKYILGAAIADGTKQITDFLNVQKFDIWDAVVLPSGHKVAIHIDKTLELDQTSLQRKVIYEQNTAQFGLTD